jgi:hypothetical protein
MGGMCGDVTGCEGDMGPMTGDCSMVAGDMTGCEGNMTNIAGDMGPVTGDCSAMSGDVTGMQGDMGGCSGDMTGCEGDMSGVSGDMTGFTGDCATAAPSDFGPVADAPPMPPMDAFDTASPEFASPAMTEARAEVNDAAAVNNEGQIEVAPDMANPAHDMAPIAPDMAAGTPEGAAEMSGGGESAGMGAMDAAMGAGAEQSQPDADAAVGQAMDSAIDQGGAPAGAGPGITQEALDDPGYVDPTADMDQSPDDDGGMAG